MPQLFTVGILAFLLLGAGYGLVQAAQPARAIPWDCSDWQAFAHADRDTAILESLAENRGKTLYCGVDQSDTFAKAETWAAGRDRNERDSTEYQGERGRFRGFIAAQEGWLTEGESGITGQPISTIFEFPPAERERRRTVRRTIRGEISSLTDFSGDPANPPASSLSGGARGMGAYTDNNQAIRESNARAGFKATYTDPHGSWYDSFRDGAGQARLLADAKARCRGGRARNAALEYAAPFTIPDNAPAWRMRTDGTTAIVWQVYPWSATCVKKVRR